MRHACSVLVLTLLAACDIPPLTLKFTLTDGTSQQCISPDTGGNPTTDCADITMLCKAVLSVRIVPPAHPEQAYISVCKPLVGAQNKLCSIAGVDLPAPKMPIPEQVLEVQMAVFQADQLTRDADGNFECPRVDFASNNLPETVACSDPDGLCPARPAVGGRTYYYPGDEETVVKLGCTELGLLTEPTCRGTSSIDVTATVNDFDTGALVGSSVADRLSVSIGEPKLNDMNAWSLTGALPLSPQSSAPPVWYSNLTTFDPLSTFCLEVSEDVAQATRSLICRQVGMNTPITRIDITGVRLAPTTLSQILTALGLTAFPLQGLVVGVVLNEFNQPVMNAIVKPTCAGCTIKYLSEDRMSFTAGPTASNGIWVSTDAPYGTTFDLSTDLTSGFGGLVEGKVTVVVLQKSTSVGM
jgi:hypothetical protein